ncbi:hypothetical protein FC83_GL000728 [Agrilactobacillus composti DSM 18527 = JCM 14202]|uniref:EH domain-containing protein n=1 Tax=Agrilactobacillus composti DSM 18527 = JCM 14202 TaxID=1423734 RepID=X0PSZ8_9LACO|nr:DUF3284 domain-containing protein [Agrilactobacillus composti]KRM31436.1 hypothetical protein FC83_GL000728 [Agrilactobacillus composti DSM 18527 = JCM 14202]GAF40386.1 hypothetical protein JCM14202_2282 [Agrilactobacillus composti DSM 18527 = JCM 14202]
MELKQVLKIPATFFYSMIINPVLYDASRYTGHRVRVDQLQGMQYTRKTSENNDDKITITKVIPNRNYTYTSEIGSAKTAVSYVLKPIDAESFQLIYSEKTAATSLWDRSKEKVRQFMSDNLRKRNLRRIWNQIEESY